MWMVVSVVAAVVLAATYLTAVANRVDRLHRRATAAWQALDACSKRRAEVATTLGRQAGLSQVQLAAKAVLAATPGDRETAENDLTRAIREAASSVDPDFAQFAAGMVEVSRQLALARQVHTDLVRDARGVRRRLLVRAFRLTRRHPVPAFFDIDEPGLELAS